MYYIEIHCVAYKEDFFKPITELPKWVFYSLRKDVKFYDVEMLWFD